MPVWTPVLTVKAAFGYGPLDASPVWTDITASTMEINPRRGRASEFDQFSPGTVTVKLKDESRLFDALNASGTYFGELVPNVPVKIEATYSATTYPIFYGFVDAWDYELDETNRVAWVSLRATDAFKILSRARLPRSVYETEVLADSPVAYWPLNETDGRAGVDLSGNGHNVTYSPTGVTRDSDGLRDFSSAVSFSGAQDSNAVGTYTPLLSGFPVSLECLLRFDEENPVASSVTLFSQYGDDGFAMVIPLTGSGLIGLGGPQGAVYAYAWEGGTGRVVGTADDLGLTGEETARVDDGGIYHIVATFDDVAGEYLIYLNGQLVTTADDASSASSARRLAIGSLLTSDGHGVTLSDVAVYDTVLSAARVAAHYAAVAEPWYGDTIGDRFDRVLDEVGWPAGLRTLDTGSTQLGSADTAGQSPHAYLQSLAATEQGRYFIGADGTVTFHGTDRVSADTAAAAVFSDDGSNNPYLAGGVKMPTDDRYIYNEAQIQRKYGQPQVASDATSVAAYGPSTYAASGLLMLDDILARGLAERIVFRYKDPQTRLESWTVTPQANVASWPDVLGLEIGDHVTFEVQPLRTGTQAQLELDIEQIVHTITPARWEITFTGSPRDPNIDLYFTIGGDGATQGIGTGILR